MNRWVRFQTTGASHERGGNGTTVIASAEEFHHGAGLRAAIGGAEDERYRPLTIHAPVHCATPSEFTVPPH